LMPISAPGVIRVIAPPPIPILSLRTKEPLGGRPMLVVSVVSTGGLIACYSKLTPTFRMFSP
jgi:hypothetical protein